MDGSARATNWPREIVFTSTPFAAASGRRDPQALRQGSSFVPLFGIDRLHDPLVLERRAPSAGELTASEQRIARLVAEGKTNREVAATLVVAERTVESALTQIYRKLDVRSRTQLARKLAGAS